MTEQPGGGGDFGFREGGAGDFAGPPLGDDLDDLRRNAEQPPEIPEFKIGDSVIVNNEGRFEDGWKIVSEKTGSSDERIFVVEKESKGFLGLGRAKKVSKEVTLDEMKIWNPKQKLESAPPPSPRIPEDLVPDQGAQEPPVAEEPKPEPVIKSVPANEQVKLAEFTLGHMFTFVDSKGEESEWQIVSEGENQESGIIFQNVHNENDVFVIDKDEASDLLLLRKKVDQIKRSESESIETQYDASEDLLHSQEARKSLADGTAYETEAAPVTEPEAGKKSKYIEGQFVTAVNPTTGEKENDWVVNVINDADHKIILTKIAEGHNPEEDDIEVTEEELDQWNTKAEDVRDEEPDENEDREIVNVNEELLEMERELADEIELRKDKPLVKKLFQYYRKHTALRVGVGVVSTVLAGVSNSHVVSNFAHGARVLIGAVGGGMAGEGFSSLSQNQIMKKLKNVRNADGDFNQEELEKINKEDLLDAYATLLESATQKGLRIQATLDRLQKQDIEELEERISEEDKEENEEGKKGILAKIKNSYLGLSPLKKTSIALAVTASAFGLNMLINSGAAESGVALAKYAGLGVSSGMQLAMGFLSSQKQRDSKIFEQSDMVGAIRSELTRRGLFESDIDRIWDKYDKNKSGRIKWAIAGSAIFGVISLLLGERGHQASDERPPVGRVPSDEAPEISTQPQPELTQQPGAPSAIDSQPDQGTYGMGQGGAYEPGGPGEHGGYQPPDTNGDGQPDRITEFTRHVGDNTLKDEIKLGGPEWKELLSRDGNGVKFWAKAVPSVMSNVSDSQRDDMVNLIAERLKSEGIINDQGNVIDFDRFNNTNPFEYVEKAYSDILSGVEPPVDMVSSLNVDPTASSDVLTAATTDESKPVNVTVTEAPNDSSSSDQTINRTPDTDSVQPTETSTESSVKAPEPSSTTVPPQNVSPDTATGSQPETPAVNDNLNSGSVENKEIPGVTDATAGLNRFEFNAATPISENKLNEILDPKNGYFSEEVAKTFSDLHKDGALPLDHFRIAQTPDGISQLKVDLNGVPGTDPSHMYIGHDSLKPIPVDVGPKSWLESIFGGGDKPPEPSITPAIESTPPTVEPTITEEPPQPSQPSGTIVSGGEAIPSNDTPTPAPNSDTEATPETPTNQQG